jgi:type I restriction enzyme, S subunit
VIPNGWREVRIRDVGQVQAGRQRSPQFVAGILRPYLRVANVFDGYIDTSDVFEMNFTDSEYHIYQLKKGDILLNEGQSLELVGRPAMYIGDPPDCCFQNTLIRFRAGKNVDPQFALNLFRFFMYSGKFVSIATQTTSVAHLGVSRFANLTIPLPPLAEQRKLAAILGTWDAAISTAERLVAALRARKQALMQRLLTGEVRDTWVSYRLGEVVDILVSNVDKKIHADEQPVKLCNYTDVFYGNYIHNALPFMEVTATQREIAKFELKLHDVLLTKDSETIPDIAQVAVVTEELHNVICGYHLAILRPNPSIVSGPFLRELLTVPSIHRQFEDSANGVTRFGLTLSAIAGVNLSLPDLAEQQKIATILSTCDRQMEYLRLYVDRLKQQKRGLMQRLLTGEVRVAVDGNDVEPGAS